MNFKSLLKKFIPKNLLQWYHYGLAFLGAVVYGFPSKKLAVIGVTGTSGKSTTVDFIARMLEENGSKVASASSIRFKINDKEWKNQLKMTMPGRMKVQKFLRQAVNAGCKYTVLEVTSEGIAQFRHAFIHFDAAVFTNLSPEHIEAHGGFENYRNEKLKLFKATPRLHVINASDPNAKYFLDIPAQKIITFNEEGLKEHSDILENVRMLGEFNKWNALAAITVATAYGVSGDVCKKALGKVQGIPGRMELVAKKPLVVVDYAHTPEQLESVYKTLSSENPKSQTTNPKLICVLGSCGGGRDRWKRPALGKLAQQYCQEIIITNEDPYDEDPMEIMEQIAAGIDPQIQPNHYRMVIDRKEAIEGAIGMAEKNDVVVITGKGSETWMCLANGKKIPWDDREIIKQTLAK